jgi:serine/threonine protein kinase
MQKDIVGKEPKLKHLNGDCLDLVKRLLHKDPNERLGAKEGISEIKNHAFFQDICWKDVYNMKLKYNKQFLKIDIINSNFHQDDSNNNLQIDIDVEEEC